MSYPYDPSQQGQQHNQQQWDGSSYQQNGADPARGQQQWDGSSYQQDGADPAGGQQQWGSGQSWTPAPDPQQPARIDWSTDPRQPDGAAWRGPGAFRAAGSPEQADGGQQSGQSADEGRWVASGSAQTAQEVAGPRDGSAAGSQHWAAEQEQAQQWHAQPEQGRPQHEQQWQPWDAQPQQRHGQPQQEQQWQRQPEQEQPPQPEQPQQSTDAAARPSVNEAATVTTPAVADPGATDEPEALTIGRGRSNSIVLDDMLVSRQHVRITADADGLVLEDLGSRNGTYVNGRRVERTHLSEGDRIGIGAATFEVRDGWLLNV